MVVGSLLLTFGSLTPGFGGDGFVIGLAMLALGAGLWLASQLAARDEGDPSADRGP